MKMVHLKDEEDLLGLPVNSFGYKEPVASDARDRLDMGPILNEKGGDCLACYI